MNLLSGQLTQFFGQMSQLFSILDANEKIVVQNIADANGYVSSSLASTPSQSAIITVSFWTKRNVTKRSRAAG